jgi:DNA-binding NarL/FixJ family response regulator
MANVFYFGNDLMFQSKIASACKAAGLGIKVFRNPHNLADDWLDGAKPNLIIVDLGLANLDLAQLYPSLRSLLPDTRWLGYGAHVLADRLEQASSLGLDAVLTRGQFERDIVRILQSIANEIADTQKADPEQTK